MPKATLNSVSSATVTGKPVAFLKTESIPDNKAPPPVNVIPLSTISAANSGAVFSKALFTASIILPIGSDNASATFL